MITASIEALSNGRSVADVRITLDVVFVLKIQFSMASELRFKLSLMLPEPLPNGLISAKSQIIGRA